MGMSKKWRLASILWAVYLYFQCHAEGDVTERSERDTENGTFSSIPYGREPHSSKTSKKRTDANPRSDFLDIPTYFAFLNFYIENNYFYSQNESFIYNLIYSLVVIEKGFFISNAPNILL